MWVKMLAKKAGVSPYDLDKAVKQISARAATLKNAVGKLAPLIPTGVDPNDWRLMLSTHMQGRARFDMANINLILSNDSVWHDRFWWDSVRGVAMLDTQA